VVLWGYPHSDADVMFIRVFLCYNSKHRKAGRKVDREKIYDCKINFYSTAMFCFFAVGDKTVDKCRELGRTGK